MKKFYMPLFWKFTIAIVAIVIVFGLINIIMFYENLLSIHEEGVCKTTESLARLFSKQSKYYLKVGDYKQLQEYIDRFYESDNSIAFSIIYIKNPSKIIGRSDEASYLLEDYDAISKRAGITKKDRVKEDECIYEVVYKISSSPQVFVRIGMYHNIGYKDFRLRLIPIIIMIIIFLTIGITGGFIFASVITNPIKNIIKISEKIEYTLSESNYNMFTKLQKRLMPIFSRHIQIKDELDILESKFSEMVSRLDEVYKEKEQSYNKLIQTEKLASIGILAAGLAHEINNPIAGIQNCIRRLNKSSGNKEQSREYLEMMAEAVDKVENVVKLMLDYSRTPEMNFQNVKINEVLEKSILLISYKFEKHHVSIINNTPENISLTFGNFNQLEQVFVNLLINGIDAIESRTAIESDFPLLIELSAGTKDGKLIVKIKDNGIGIKGEDKVKVFDPFYTTKEPGMGTGLGLYVCYGIIQAHKGEIKIESEYLKGTTVIIELPLSSE